MYIILLTAKGHQTEIIEGLEAGADDYITKPYDLQELKARLRAGKRILELQEQLVSAREQLRVQATHDSLTGLFNRPAILEASGARDCAVQSREKADGGHHGRSRPFQGYQRYVRPSDRRRGAAGDGAAHVVFAAAPTTSSDATVARNFWWSCLGSDLQAAVELAERLRQNVSAQPVDVRGRMIPVTLSLGVATVAPGSEQSVQTAAPGRRSVVCRQEGRPEPGGKRAQHRAGRSVLACDRARSLSHYSLALCILVGLAARGLSGPVDKRG